MTTAKLRIHQWSGTCLTPGGQVVKVSPVLPIGAGLGTPTFLYSMVRYDLKASVAVPGKLGLWRTKIVPGGGEIAPALGHAATVIGGIEICDA